MFFACLRLFVFTPKMSVSSPILETWLRLLRFVTLTFRLSPVYHNRFFDDLRDSEHALNIRQEGGAWQLVVVVT